MNASEPVIVVRVELRCFACDRCLGVLETRRWPSLGPALFTPVGSGSAVSVSDWSRLRCAACRGNPYAGESRTVRVYPPVSWDDLEGPRRGRPPTWLVAQRRAARESQGDTAGDP